MGFPGLLLHGLRKATDVMAAVASLALSFQDA